MNAKIRLTTLTPVHIGSGKEYQCNSDVVYFREKNKIAVVDESKVLKAIGEDNLDLWVQNITKGGNFLDFLRDRRFVPTPANIGVEALEMEAIGTPPNGQQTIKACMRTGTMLPYLPGSSLKGALRTAILNELIKKEPGFASDTKNHEKYNKHKQTTTYEAKKLESHYLGDTPNTDILRLLRVGDFSPAGETETQCIKSSILNLMQSRWDLKPGQTVYMECLPKGAVLEGAIGIPEDLKKNAVHEGVFKNKTDFITLPEIFDMANRHTIALLEGELGFWEDQSGKPRWFEEYAAVLEEVLATAQKCAQGKECVFRTGAGSGWDFMTGAWPKEVDSKGNDILDEQSWAKIKKAIRKKHYSENVPFPKTRKQIEGEYLLGFVKMAVG